MEKPIVAIDIDDVLVDTSPEIIAHYNQTWGTKLTLANFYVPIDPHLWAAPDEATALGRIGEFVQSEDHFTILPSQVAVDALRTISKSYNLRALTGRSDSVAEATTEWLDANFPDTFSSVSFSNLFDKDKIRSKGEMCVEMGAQILIDDYLGHAISAANCGLKVVLFGDFPWNQADTLPSGVTRCLDWPAVLEYFEQRGHGA